MLPLIALPRVVKMNVSARRFCATIFYGVDPLDARPMYCKVYNLASRTGKYV